MIKRKCSIRILIWLMALVFIATSAQAREKEYEHKWYNPFAGIWSAISSLSKDTKRVDRKVKHLDRRVKHIDRKIGKMTAKGIVGPRGPKGDKGEPGPQGPEGRPGKSTPLICPGCDFSETTEFSGFDFTGALLMNSNFEYADISFAQFIRAKLKNAWFKKTDLKGTSWDDADLSMVKMYSANLCGADLRAANLDGIFWYYNSSSFNETVCPDGSCAGDNGGSCEGHLEPVLNLDECPQTCQ